MNKTQTKNHPAWLGALLIAALMLVAGVAQAQNEVRSTDLTQSLRTFVDNMNAAQSAEQAARSKAAELLKAAEAPAAQFNDTNLPPQTRFEAHAKVIGLRKNALQTQLEAARQGAKLLSAAKEALHDINADLGGNIGENLKDLPAPEDQPKVDASISELNFPADATIEPETADALAAAREYFDMASKGSKGPAGSASFQAVASRLKAWEAKNRRTIVLCDAGLKRLELAAVSGLTSIGNYTLDKALGSSANFDPASLDLGGVPLAPEISANGQSSASSTPAKVSLRRALKQ